MKCHSYNTPVKRVICDRGKILIEQTQLSSSTKWVEKKLHIELNIIGYTRVTWNLSHALSTYSQ